MCLARGEREHGYWYLVSDDLPFAGGQRLPPEGPHAGIQPQLLRFVWHWKHRRTESHMRAVSICPLQNLHLLQQQQRCGEEGESEEGTCCAAGPCTVPSPVHHRLQPAPVPGPSLQGADTQAELLDKGHLYILCAYLFPLS